MQIAALGLVNFMIPTAETQLIAYLRDADLDHAQTFAFKLLTSCGKLLRVNLDHHAQLFIEQCTQRVLAQPVEADVYPAVSCESHLAQRDEQAAVAAVVIRQ